jgi:hypothetical protein
MKLKIFETKDQFKTHAKIRGGLFKILQGQNWINSWNQNSIEDPIEQIQRLRVTIKRGIYNLI